MVRIENSKTFRVGVLALQGGFSEHVTHLHDSAVNFSEKIKIQEVRTGSDLKNADGLIIPGGESTSISILLSKNEPLRQALREFALKKPVFGTCAGMILLANEVENEPGLIGGLNIRVIRNFYGSQMQSFEAFVSIENKSLGQGTQRMLFIRAPGVTLLKGHMEKVKILAKHKDSIVAVRENNLIATSFHPELTSDLNWHIYFLKMVIDAKNQE